MKDLIILKGLYDAVNATYPDVPVIFPNEPIDEETTGNGIFFEIAVAGRAWTRETEESTISTTVGSIIINGRQNSGVGAVDGMADALLSYFAPLYPALRNGFSWQDETNGVVSRAYVTEVQRSESGISNGRFKVTIFITLEIYEGME